MEEDRIVEYGDGRVFRAPVTIAADGNGSRLALAMGLTKRTDRPMGVAVRTYSAPNTTSTTTCTVGSNLDANQGNPTDAGYGCLRPGNGTPSVDSAP